MFAFIRKTAKNESGSAAIEYGLLVALIAVGLITTLPTVGGKLVTMFTNVATALPSGAASTTTTTTP
ncbi:pilus assembly protein Flp/PilA [Azospirillaceae bacterium]